MSKKIQSINPYTGELNWEFELLSNEELDKKIEIAHNAFLSWKDTSFEYRKKLFYKLAEVIESNLDKYAKIQTIEMWMLYNVSRNALKWTANLIRWFADNAEKVLWKKEYNENWTHWIYMYDPLWVIYGIWPWNLPYNQVLRAAVPNILAWNTTVYKHASNVPMCGIAIEEFFIKAGFPEWIYTNVLISSSQSERIIANKHIRWINLTGWENAWKTIWSLAWKYLKPSVLELWWNDPLLILDHKNTKNMVSLTQACRFNDSGQRCNSSKRFIVLEKYYNDFIKHMKDFVEQLKIWDPMDINTNIQPLAHKKAAEWVDLQVKQSIEAWAKLITGWKILWEQKTFYAPTILADVKPGMKCYDEEIFWPVMSIIKSKNIKESIKIANDSDYGLSAVVYWDDENQCREVAFKLEWWMIFINQVAGSKAHLPFGWVKKSWYWKENWPEWLRAFTNKKIILF